tara:strand:+ start:167 stop:457 length:291 start_codon:yes stop_codon:yes gene_type:complete
MKKILIIIFLFPFLSNCTQYTSMIGPSITMVQTGNVIKATGSLSSSLAMNSVKQSLADEINNERICPSTHSSELSEIFFESSDLSNCFYDPMSIYR